MTSIEPELRVRVGITLERCVGLVAVLCLNACTIVRTDDDSERGNHVAQRSHDGAADEHSTADAGAPPRASVSDAGVSAEGDGADAAVTNSVSAALEATLPPWQNETPRPMYRLDLVRDESGVVSVSQVIGVESEIQPLTAFGYDYLVRGWVGDEVVAAFPMQFPVTALRTGMNDEGGWLHDSKELTSSSASVFLPADPALDRIEVLAQGGESFDVEPELLSAVTWSSAVQKAEREQRSSASAAPGVASRGAASTGVATLGSALTSGELHDRYGHITFLTTADAAALKAKDPDALAGGKLTDPTPEMNDVIAKALAAAPPALLTVASSIAVVRFGKNVDTIGAPETGSAEALECMGGGPSTGYARMGDSLAFANGSLMLLNVDFMLDERMGSVLVHELTHQFVMLSEAVTTDNQELVKNWGTSSIELVETLRTKFRLGSGILQTWQKLHETGVQTEHACGYAGSYASRIDQAGAMRGGFASYYGSVDAMEDIAEYVRTTQFPSEKYPGVCPLFALASEVTEDTAIAFGKLTLLRGMGLITEEAYQRCAGGVQHPSKPGIHFQGSLSFDDQLKSGHLDDQGFPKFGFMGNGPDSYQLLIKVSLPKAGAPPLGLHRLGGIWFFNVDDPRVSGAYLGHDDNFKARASESGLVLITEASDQRVQGVFFGLTFQNAWAFNTDYVPYGTFLIPRGGSAPAMPPVNITPPDVEDDTNTDPTPPVSSETETPDGTIDMLESAGCATGSVSTGDQTLTLEVGAESREVVLHVPANYDGSKPAPLIVDFHALGDSGPNQRMASSYPAQTAADGVIMAFPTGKSGPSGAAWNVGPCCVADVDDVEFAKLLVETIEQSVCIDRRRVYAVGTSNGGGMAYELACHAADVFAAVASAGFDLLEESVADCTPARPISVVSFRGTDDASAPYDGGNWAEVPDMPITLLGAEATFAKWAELNACSGAPSAEDENGCSAYSECKGGTEVVLCNPRGGDDDAGPASIAWPMLARHALP